MTGTKRVRRKMAAQSKALVSYFFVFWETTKHASGRNEVRSNNFPSSINVELWQVAGRKHPLDSNENRKTTKRDQKRKLNRRNIQPAYLERSVKAKQEAINTFLMDSNS